MIKDLSDPLSSPPINAGRDVVGVHYCRGRGYDAGYVRACVNPDASCSTSPEGIEAGTLDFVVAHLELQRLADPLLSLVDWILLLREEGILYVSVPDRRVTQDNLRIPTPPSHFLLDYLYGTRSGDYENREHAAAHFWSWPDAGRLEGRTKEESAGLVYAAVHGEDRGVNRHVFNIDTLRFIVETATKIAGRGGGVVLARDGSDGDHLLVYRASGKNHGDSAALERIVEIRSELRLLVDTVVLDGLEGCLVGAISAPNRGKLMAVKGKRLSWIMSPLALYHLGLSQRDPVLFEPGDRSSTAFGEDIHYTRSLPIESRLRGMEAMPGIEMSPGAVPILSKARFNVEYLDKVDHLGPSGTYLDGAPVLVDIVLGDRLIDEVLDHHQYHYLVSSHVIEHVPDFIQFFKSADNILAENGKLLMWVPDKRYTFDLLRQQTEIRDVISAHEMKLRCPSRAMVHDFYANVDFSASTAEIWCGQYAPKPTYPAVEAANIALKADLATTDVHCFAFTPASMGKLLAYVAEFHVPRMRVLGVSETQQDTNEFIVEIEFCAKN